MGSGFAPLCQRSGLGQQPGLLFYDFCPFEVLRPVQPLMVMNLLETGVAAVRVGCQNGLAIAAIDQFQNQDTAIFGVAELVMVLFLQSLEAISDESRRCNENCGSEADSENRSDRALFADDYVP